MRHSIPWSVGEENKAASIIVQPRCDLPRILASHAVALAPIAEFAYRAARKGAELLSKIDLAAAWDDARAMGVANRDLLGAVAGMFLLLPAVIAEQFIKAPEALGENATNEMVLARMAQYAELNWPVLLAYAVVSSFGILTLHALLLRPERLTVRESLRAALPILPGYVIANLLQGLGVMTGMLLFLIPGFYLIGRLALIAPVSAAEGQSNPVTILQRSAVLTYGNGWRIFGVLSIIFVTMFILGLVLSTLVGVVAELLLPADVADLAMVLVSAIIETARAVLVVLVCAALYRAASARPAGVTGMGRL